MASYMRLILTGDLKNPKVRPCIEKAFELSFPLLLETGALRGHRGQLRPVPEELPGPAAWWTKSGNGATRP